MIKLFSLKILLFLGESLIGNKLYLFIDDTLYVVV
jgi:hypothetical protein